MKLYLKKCQFCEKPKLNTKGKNILPCVKSYMLSLWNTCFPLKKKIISFCKRTFLFVRYKYAYRNMQI